MAMLPFCGYNMADYWTHWLAIGRSKGAKLPRIFYVNWFRKTRTAASSGRASARTSRVLKWMFERCAGKAAGRETPIGTIPAPRDLELFGLTLPAGDLETLLSVDAEGWLHEIPLIREYYAQFGMKLPAALVHELDQLEERLRQA